MPFAAINGQKLFYTDSGGEGKPVLVFSHGLLMDHSMFDPQVAALKDSYRCIAWDERGHGQTATPGTCAPFSYYDSADDLAALLAHLGVQQAVLVGMSQGGYLSLRCALTHREVVRALVLIDTQAMPEDPALMPHHMAMVQRWVQSGMDDGMAATVESFILGNHWDGANEWKIKWKRPTWCSALPLWGSVTISRKKLRKFRCPRWSFTVAMIARLRLSVPRPWCRPCRSGNGWRLQAQVTRPI